MTILAIDTSTKALSVAIVNEKTVLGEVSTNINKTHSIQAMPAITQLMKHCEVTTKDLTRIVVAIGPGSFTGIRIGVTIAKSLAWSLGIEVVGVSSLEVLAQNGQYFDGYISPVIDARRGAIFTALFKCKNGTLTRCEADQNVESITWAKRLQELNKPVLFIGTDVTIHQQAFQEILQREFVQSELANSLPSASALALLGKERAATEVHQLVPNYARLAEAESNWLAAQNRQ